MQTVLRYLSGRQDLVLIGLLMVSVAVMIIPLPTILMDILIAANIAFTLLVLVVAVYLKRPDDFSAFPAIILLATTFRLAISISTTRLILSEADAGAIVDTFGSFVTAGSVAVGLVIFLVITTVQFIVVTKGAERVAEVAARFTLDGLPGRQMSIDAELRNGDIDAETAQRKRSQLERENQFFGAMDGAMKFVKGDAIAGLIIVAINLVGGLAIGMLVDKLPVGAAIDVYSRLTVGDGLISQIPALIVALSAGTIITRVNSGKDNDLGKDIVNQLGSAPRALYGAGGLVALMSAIPGFPVMVFLPIAGLLLGAGYMVSRRQRTAEEAEELGDWAPSSRQLGERGVPAAAIQAEPGAVIVLALGQSVRSAIESATFHALRQDELDRAFARTGLRLPMFGVSDDPSLDPDKVRFVLDGVAGFDARVEPGMRIAIADADLLELNGQAVRPLEAKWELRSAHWIEPHAQASLEAAGAETFDVTELLVRAAARFTIRNSGRIVGYKHIQAIIRELGAEHENLASQVSQTISAIQLLNLVRKLLMEGVPLLPRRILFEALLEASVTSTGSEHMIRSARAAPDLRIDCLRRQSDRWLSSGAGA
jgi:type III secretion protein V